jgi:hypothetical protein
MKRRNHSEFGSPPSTKYRAVDLESLDSLCSFEDQIIEDFEIPKESTSSEHQNRRTLHSYRDEEKGGKFENISMQVQPLVLPSRRMNSLARDTLFDKNAVLAIALVQTSVDLFAGTFWISVFS